MDNLVNYCLYARKSSESDERQAMSIESQTKEMMLLAKKEGLYVKEVRIESHSAKVSGKRPVFAQLISEIKQGTFNGILTWAPDRLSRNAGDLGVLVDLMDQEKLAQIRTYSQSFSNNPNEKFLLMILCSQAKLENDQKGLNVKRGIKAKCEMGWRPCMAPIGYFSRTLNGIKDIVVDPEKSNWVKEMFERVAQNGESGRAIKRWLDSSNFTTRAGKLLTLSMIYRMLKNSFYYGEFEYPIGSGKWFTGSHQALITKGLFEDVQKQLITTKKSDWQSITLAYRGIIYCGRCGSAVSGEIKKRKLQNGRIRKHTYYHCAKSKNPDCPEEYVKEKDLTKAFLKLFTNVDSQDIVMSMKLKMDIKEYQNVKNQILLQHDINPEEELDIPDYAKYVFLNGNITQKKMLIKSVKKSIYLHKKELFLK